jgi:hypothetical protein
MIRKSILIFLAIIAISNKANAHSPTWTDGIACIVYSHCSSCHNPKGIAPFSLTTYTEVYQNRLSIAASVQAKSMPPFPADQSKRKYAHANTLDKHEIDEIVEWVSNFAPLGDANNVPPVPTYNTNYQITNPSKVVQIPTYNVNTTNDLYRCFTLQLNNATQEFIESIEVVPGNRDIVHHALVFQDTSLTPLNLDNADPLPGYSAFGSTGSSSSRLVFGYTPGQGAFYYPLGFGARIQPNSYIVIQIHYPGGVSNEKDSTQVRIKYGSSTLRNISTQAILNHTTTLQNGPLIIPPNQIKTFNNKLTINNNTTITGVMPHMHLLGRKIKSFAVTANGDTIHIVNIPDWDFHWQGFYQFQKPILIPKGSTLYGEATYDNTTSNPYNPKSPPDTIRQGEGTDDEMFLIYFNFTTYAAGDTSIIIDTSSHYRHDSVCYRKATNSIQNYSIEEIELYPNPTTSKLMINSNIIFNEIVLFDNQGKEVLKEQAKVSELDLSKLQKGIYYVRLSHKDGQTFYKKVKKE